MSRVTKPTKNHSKVQLFEPSGRKPAKTHIKRMTSARKYIEKVTSAINSKKYFCGVRERETHTHTPTHTHTHTHTLPHTCSLHTQTLTHLHAHAWGPVWDPTPHTCRVVDPGSRSRFMARICGNLDKVHLLLHSSSTNTCRPGLQCLSVARMQNTLHRFYMRYASTSHI